jgi:hypothetical protein
MHDWSQSKTPEPIILRLVGTEVVAPAQGQGLRKEYMTRAELLVVAEAISKLPSELVLACD